MLRIPSGVAALWAANLRRNGIWVDGNVHCEAWYNGQFGLTGFFTDMLAAEGLVERRLSAAGEAEYRGIGGREPWQNQ